MQTYNPIRGMTVCVSGGEYVNRKDAENKIAALRDKLSEMIIVNGQALACSPYVKSAYDKQDAEIARLQDLIKRTNELFNPCGHTGLESSVCEICGYPVPSKLIAALKEKIKGLEELQYVYENTPFAHWMERTKKAEAYKSDVENAKYKAFWDDSRLADRQQWERYDWPKHQKEDSQ